MIGNKRMGRGESLNQELSLEKKILYTIWMLGNTESLSGICDKLNLDQKTAVSIFGEVCSDIIDLAKDVIKWPGVERCAKIADSFEDQYGFPGVIGVIGGCYIPMIPPKDESCKYLNSLGVHSVVLQAVCDDKMYFTDIFVGCPGKMSLGRVLGVSPLYAKIGNKQNPLIEPRKHILGDKNYPQLATLLTPYDSLSLNDQQQKFNRLHRSARKVIDEAMDRLRGRFKRLKYIHFTPVEFVNQIVVSACVLHNFIIEQGDDSWTDEWSEDLPLLHDPCISPTEKRNYIAERL